MLATGSWDNTAKLWRVSDGALLRTFTGHTLPVNSVYISPDGSLVATGSWDNTVKLWNVSDGALVRTLEGHTDSVNAVSFSPDGSVLASGSNDQTVKLWQVADGTLVGTLEGHTGGIESVCFSADGSLIASAGTDCEIRIWRTADGALLRTLEGHTLGVTSVSLSPDAELLTSGSYDGTVNLWSVDNGALLRSVEPQLGYCVVAFSPDGSFTGCGFGVAVGLLRNQPVTSETCTLTVNGGTGSGTYPIGSVVVIAAEVPEGYRFERWVGDVDEVADARAPRTVIRLGGDRTVRAVIRLAGDLDNDGRVTVMDAIFALCFALGLGSPSEGALVAADLNWNGSVEVSEATEILKMAVGL